MGRRRRAIPHFTRTLLLVSVAEIRPMKYALIGAGGQLGRDLQSRLQGEVVPWTREQADLTRPADLRAALEALRPDVVVNCAAYNLVDKAESDPASAFAVNAWGVRDLAMACRDL